VKNIERIGLNDKECPHCHRVKTLDEFRSKRAKCRDCERGGPKENFKRYVPTRINNCSKNCKEESHVEYLECSTDEYMNWITSHDHR